MLDNDVIILEINQESEAHQQKYNEITEKKNSLYNSELHLGQFKKTKNKN